MVRKPKRSSHDEAPADGQTASHVVIEVRQEGVTPLDPDAPVAPESPPTAPATIDEPRGQDAAAATPAALVAMHGGRPRGSATRPRPAVIYRPPHCPSCQSTRRAPFRDGPVADDEIETVIDGQPYNREVWRDTSCLDCGQHYRVIEFRFEPEEGISQEIAAPAEGCGAE